MDVSFLKGVDVMNHDILTQPRSSVICPELFTTSVGWVEQPWHLWWVGGKQQTLQAGYVLSLLAPTTP